MCAWFYAQILLYSSKFCRSTIEDRTCSCSCLFDPLIKNSGSLRISELKMRMLRSCVTFMTRGFLMPSKFHSGHFPVNHCIVLRVPVLVTVGWYFDGAGYGLRIMCLRVYHVRLVCVCMYTWVHAACSAAVPVCI